MKNKKTTQKISEISIIIYILLGFSLFVLTLIFGVNWTNQPFAGKFIEQGLMVSPSKVIGVDTSSEFMNLEGYSESSILALNDRTLYSNLDLNEQLSMF